MKKNIIQFKLDESGIRHPVINGIQLLKRPLLSLENRLLNGPAFIVKSTLGISQNQANPPCLYRKDNLIFMAGRQTVHLNTVVNKLSYKKVSANMDIVTCWSVDEVTGGIAIAYTRGDKIQGFQAMPEILYQKFGNQIVIQSNCFKCGTQVRLLCVGEFSLLAWVTDLQTESMITLKSILSGQESTFLMQEQIVGFYLDESVQPTKAFAVSKSILYELDKDLRVPIEIYKSENKAQKYKGLSVITVNKLFVLVTQTGQVQLFSYQGAFVISRSRVPVEKCWVSAMTSSKEKVFIALKGVPSLFIIEAFSLEKDKYILNFNRIDFRVPSFRAFHSLSESNGTLAMTFTHKIKLTEGLLGQSPNIAIIDSKDRDKALQVQGDSSKDQELGEVQVCYATFHYMYHQGVAQQKLVDDIFAEETIGRVQKISLYEIGKLCAIVDSYNCLKLIRLKFRREQRVELSYKFVEKVVSLDVNILGTMLIVSCKQLLRIYSILSNTIQKLYSENVQNCLTAVFSKCNRYFAYSLNSQILVRNLYTYQVVAQITSHNSIVRKIQFLNYHYMLSYSHSGVYIHQCTDFSKEFDFIDRRRKILLAKVDIIHFILLTYQEGGFFEVKSLVNQNYQLSFQLPDKLSACDIILYPEERCLIIALNNGNIRVYSWPFLESGIDQISYIDYYIHSASVTCMVLNKLERTLVSCAEDGVIVLSSLIIYTDGECSQYESYYESIADSATKLDFHNNNYIKKLLVSNNKSELQDNATIKSLKDRISTCNSMVVQFDQLIFKKDKPGFKFSQEVLTFKDSHDRECDLAIKKVQRQCSQMVQSLQQNERQLKRRVGCIKQQIQDQNKNIEQRLKELEESNSNRFLNYYTIKDTLEENFLFKKAALKFIINLKLHFQQSQFAKELAKLEDRQKQLVSQIHLTEQQIELIRKKYEILRTQIREQQFCMQYELLQKQQLGNTEKYSIEIQSINAKIFKLTLMIDEMQRLNEFLLDLKNELKIQISNLSQMGLKSPSPEKDDIANELVLIKNKIDVSQSRVQNLESLIRKLRNQIDLTQKGYDEMQVTVRRLGECLLVCQNNSVRRLQSIKEMMNRKNKLSNMLVQKNKYLQLSKGKRKDFKEILFKANARLNSLYDELQRLLHCNPQELVIKSFQLLNSFRQVSDPDQLKPHEIGLFQLREQSKMLQNDQKLGVKIRGQLRKNWSKRQNQKKFYLQQFNSIRYDNTKLQQKLRHLLIEEENLKRTNNYVDPKPPPKLLKNQLTPFQKRLAQIESTRLAIEGKQTQHMKRRTKSLHRAFQSQLNKMHDREQSQRRLLIIKES